jgi:hypothetical protein
MAGNEQAAQLPVIWLLRDVVWVVIGHLTTRATKQAEDCNYEPLVHFVILSNSARHAGLSSGGISGIMAPGAAPLVGSADATALDFQWKRKSRQSKRRTLAVMRTRDDSRGLTRQQTTSVAIGAVICFSGSSIFHRLAFVPNAFVMSSRDRLTASSIESANTQCRKRSAAPARLHHTQ